LPNRSDSFWQSADFAWLAAIAFLLALQFVFLRPWLGTFSLWLPIYFVVFLATWKWASKRNALILALPLTIAVLFIVPAVWGWAIETNAPDYRLAPVDIAEPIRLTGDVRLETGVYRDANAYTTSDPIQCDLDCLALLFSDGVTSVTVNRTHGLSFEDIRDGNSGLTASARSFSLKPFGDCADGEEKPIIDRSRSSFNWTKSNTEAAVEWIARSVDEICLASDQPLQTFDFLVRNGVWGRPEAPNFHLMGAPEFGFLHDCSAPAQPRDQIGFHYSELRTGGGKLLFRDQDFRINVPQIPLALNTRRCWHFPALDTVSGLAWRAVEPAPRPNDPSQSAFNRSALNSVFRNIQWRSNESDQELLDEIQNILARALSDGTLKDDTQAKRLVSAYVRLLSRIGANDTDARIVSGIILDPGLRNFQSAEALGGIFDEEAMRVVREAIATKLLTGERRVEGDFLYLSYAYSGIPVGEFSGLLPIELKLLRRDSGDNRIKGMIEKMPELGSEAAPLLARLAVSYIEDEIAAGPYWREQEHSNRKRKAARLDNAKAAVRGLCLLGRDASGQLPKLRSFGEQIEWDGGYPLYLDWHRMLLSLGEDRQRVTKGGSGWSGDDESYRQALESQIEAGCELRMH
jgi:hypothetical protein